MQLNCKADDKCLIATEMAGVTCIVNDAACKACIATKQQGSINKVTSLIAIAHIKNAGMTIPDSLIISAGIVPKITEGPGTELKKLISWFHSPKKKKCSRCSNRIQKMNTWGPDECEKRIHTIIRWLKHSARIHNIPFFEPAVRLLIRKAIKNSRLQSQQPPGKTAP